MPRYADIAEIKGNYDETLYLSRCDECGATVITDSMASTNEQRQHDEFHEKLDALLKAK